MNELKFIEVDKDKFVRLDEIRGFYKKDENISIANYEGHINTNSWSYCVIVFKDGSMSKAPLEFFEKLKKAVNDEKNNA